MDAKEYAKANECLQRIIDADIAFFPEALNIAKETFKALGDNQGYEDLLRQALSQGGGASVAITLAQHMIELGEIKEAEQLVLDGLYRHPTMKSFQHLMKMHLQQAEDGQAKESLTMLEKLVEQQIKFRPGYRCIECGFPSHRLYWHCPSCKNWGSIKRLRGLDGE